MELSELVKKTQSLADTATGSIAKGDSLAAYFALNELDDLLADELIPLEPPKCEKPEPSGS